MTDEPVPSSKPTPFDQFLSEFKASLDESQSDAILRRINTERLIRLIADELIGAQGTQSIRILADRQIAGEAAADFLIQIDDYDVRLEIVDTADENIIIPDKILARARQLLEDNPSTVALVLVWTTDELKAVHLSLARLRRIEQNADGLIQLAQRVKPLLQVLTEIIEVQTKQWEFVLQPPESSVALRKDSRQLFENAIGSAMEAERDRAYKNLERKLAARQFPIEEEKRLIFSVLRDALQGAPAKELQSRLTKLSHRGGQ